MQHVLAKNGVLETQQNTSIGIYYNTKTGHTRKANITQNNNKFVALFEDDDVDFFIRVTNSNNIRRDFRYHMTINNDEYNFVVPSGFSNDLRALVTNGRHLHFISESSRDGKQLLRKMATRLSITPDRAAGIMSTLKFDVAYSNRTHEIKVRCGVTKQIIYGTVLALSSETISVLKERIKQKWSNISDEAFELYYDNTPESIDDTTRIDDLKSERVKIIFSSTFHREPFTVSIRQNGVAIFDLQITSNDSINHLRREICKRAPFGVKESCDVHIRYENFDLNGGFVMDYGFVPGISLEISHGPMQIFLKTLVGKTVTFKCFKSDKIMVMKRFIEKTERIPCDQQRLISGVYQLDEDRTFNEYNIGRESTVHLSLRLRGGKLSVTAEELSDTPANKDSTDLKDGVDSDFNDIVEVADVGERGLVCFGQNTNAIFKSVKFSKDTRIGIQPFVIELRLSKETTRRRSLRLQLKAQSK